MNPFTQDINRILNDKPVAAPVSPPDSTSPEFSATSDLFSLSQTVPPESNTNRTTQISLQDISNGFENQSRRYDRFLSTDN